jgi:hypothetical protein
MIGIPIRRTAAQAGMTSINSQASNLTTRWLIFSAQIFGPVWWIDSPV